jgi:aldehyde:ferredoxin oxidoreductase
MGQKLARLGFKAVIFEGKAKESTAVKIDKDGVSFSSAATLAGLGCYAIVDRLKSQYGNKVCIGCTGPAGDLELTASSIIFTTPDFHLRVAARGGLGAVMGSKKLKAVIVDDGGSNLTEVRDPQKLKENVAAITKAVVGDHFVEGLRRLGTPQIVMITQMAGALPTKNFSMGQFEKAEQISGEYMEELLKNRPNAKTVHACMQGCIISCSNVYTDEKGDLITASIEYESIALIGSNCLISDLDMIARINRACNDAGVDTMDIGSALAVAMEGGLLPWGDAKGALKLVEEINIGTENGRMIGSGAKVTGDKLGVTRVPQVKGQALSAYDPRILKGTGVTFATSPQGADHTAGIVLPGPHHPEYVPVAPNGQAPESRFMQEWMASIDTLGYCMMIGMTFMEQRKAKNLDQYAIDALSGVTGEQYPETYINDLGAAVLAIERRFNKGAGLTERDDRLPKYFSNEKLGPGQFVYDVPELDLDSVHPK